MNIIVFLNYIINILYLLILMIFKNSIKSSLNHIIKIEKFIKNKSYIKNYSISP